MDPLFRLVNLPFEMQTRQLGLTAFVREIGFGSSFTPTVSDIADQLARDANLVDGWLGYSEDKRCDRGWYFLERHPGAFEVGWFPDGERTVFKNRTIACATFILKELASNSTIAG